MLRRIVERLPWAVRLAAQRLASQWRSLLTVIAGVLLGASVGALVPLYTTAVAQVSMVETLNQLPEQDIHAAVSLSLIPAKTENTADTIQRDDAQFREIVERTLIVPFPGWINQ